MRTEFMGGVFKQGLKVPVPAWTAPTQTNVYAGPVCRNDGGERSRNEIFHLHNLDPVVKPRGDNGGAMPGCESQAVGVTSEEKNTAQLGGMVVCCFYRCFSFTYSAARLRWVMLSNTPTNSTGFCGF